MLQKEIIKKFNDITKDLLNDMKGIIGSSYSFKFNMISRVNSSLPIQKFNVNVLKFKKYILEKNPEYFTNESIIINELKDFSDNEKEYYMNEYYYLKNIYENIDNQSKDNLWDILIVLTYLCENYHNN